MSHLFALADKDQKRASRHVVQGAFGVLLDLREQPRHSFLNRVFGQNSA